MGEFPLKFKSKISINSITLLTVVALFEAFLIYSYVRSSSWQLLVLSAFIGIPLVLFFIPMFLFAKFVFADHSLILSAGLLQKLDIPYQDMYGYQLTDQAAQVDYGFSNRKVAIYYTNHRGDEAVVTVGPKYIRDFVDALKAHTGLDVTPSEPGYQEIQEAFNKDQSEEQRRAARKRFFKILKEGYVDKKLEVQSRERLYQKVEAARQRKSAGNKED